APRAATVPGEARTLVTGGTGFLGREVVRALLADGKAVRVLGRRLPPGRDRLPDVEYVVCDLSAPVAPDLLAGIDTVIHCAAETVGGWEAHRRNSLEAAEHLMRAAAAAGVRRVIHVSSLGVLGGGSGGEAISERSPLHAESDRLGPYVWGKLES